MGLFSMTQTAAFAGKIFDNKNSTEPMIKMTSFKPSFPWKYESERLTRCTPEEEGIPSSLIYAFLKAVAEDRTLNIHNVTVLRNGKILCEASFGAERLDVWKYTFSACKSVVSLAVGMLIDDGLIDLGDHVVDFFPKETTALVKLKLKDLTIEDLLTMRSPVLFGEIDSIMESDWLRGYFSAPIKGEAGETFKYNSLNTYILSAIVTKKTGISLSDFVDKRLFSPLGIARNAWYWEKCPKDIEKGGWGLYLYPEDFCKIAQLVMQKGVWCGKRLISEEYLNAATTAKVEVTEESALFNYGYHIWVGKQTNTFLFNGMLGQNVIGFKNNGVIVVSNAGNGEFFQQSNYFRYLVEFFDKAFDTSCAPNPEASAMLSQYTSSLSAYYKPETKLSLWARLLRWFQRKDEPPAYEFDSLAGTRFEYFSGYEKAVGILPLILQAVQNHYPKGFKSVSFEKEHEKRILVYEENDNVLKIPLGFDVPQNTELFFGENRFLVATQAKFKCDEEDRKVLVIRMDFLEFPSSRVLKFIFLDDSTILLRQEELPGKEFAVDTVREHVGELIDKPLLSGIMDLIGIDFLEFKAERAFAPELILKRSKNNSEDNGTL